LTDSLALISAARQALDAARTLPDMKAVRDTAETLRAYAKARGMGIESENMAAEIRLRAERMIGAELIRMAAAGELYTSAGMAGKIPLGKGGFARDRSVPNLLDLGLTHESAEGWRKLARLDDPTFEGVIGRAYSLDRRLARIDFARVAESILSKQVKPEPEPEEPEDDEPVLIRVHDPGVVTGDIWSMYWARAVAALRELGRCLALGWPVVADRTAPEWADVDAEINDAGRDLLQFQKRVHAHIAALGVCSTADIEKETADVA